MLKFGIYCFTVQCSPFDRWLVEAVQGIALSSGTFFVPFAQILEYFIILWFTTSLDMILKIEMK